MKNTKTFKVVMLPTEKDYQIGEFGIWINKSIKGEKLVCGKKIQEPSNMECIPQHLYIISGEEINHGDYLYSTAFNNIRQSAVDKYEADGCYKIIASTDKLLINDGTFNSIKWEQNTKLLPRLPESFINAYIKAYNEGKPIETVDLEMTNNGWTEIVTDYPFIKTRPDGSVIVHQSKMYSAEEMFLNMQYYMEYCEANGYVTPQKWLQDHKHF